MLANPAKQISHHLRSVAGLAAEVGECGLDAARKVPLAHAKRNRLLLPRLGEIGLESGPQEVRHDAFRDIVDFGKRILGALEWSQTDKLDSLSKLVQVLHCLLHFLQAIANRVWLDRNLEDGIAHRAFVEEVIDAHRVGKKVARRMGEQRAQQAESWIQMRWRFRCRDVIAVEKVEATRKRLLQGGPSFGRESWHRGPLRILRRDATGNAETAFCPAILLLLDYCAIRYPWKSRSECRPHNFSIPRRNQGFVRGFAAALSLPLTVHRDAGKLSV